MALTGSKFKVLKNSETVARFDDVSISQVLEGSYTYYLEISMVSPEEKQRVTLQTIPMDPMDNTLGGTLTKETIKALGSRAPAVLEFLSKFLIEQHGAKKFLMIPSEVDMPEFVSPETAFARFKQGSLERVKVESAKVLQEYKAVHEELNRDYKFVTDMNTILQGYNAKVRFQEIQEVLQKARFTETKMKEYSEYVSRFLNENIRPMFVVNKNTNKIAGLIRALMLGESFAYVSDEVMDQEILALDKFPGANDDEKYQNRDKFLLAFLMHNACEQILKDQAQLLIIAASGREKNYEAAGYQGYPLQVNGMKMVMKFDMKRGPELEKIKETIGALEIPTDNLSAHVALSLLAAKKVDVNPVINPEIDAQQVQTRKLS